MPGPVEAPRAEGLRCPQTPCGAEAAGLRFPLAPLLAILLLAPGAVLGVATLDVPAATPPLEAGASLAAAPIPGSNGFTEPSIEVSPAGRIFVTAIQGLPSRSPIWEKVGTSWVHRGTGATRTGEIGGGDADLEFDSQGRGYHSDLWLGNDGVSVSADGGTSWLGAPVSHYVFGNDRQWFAHYRDQYLYTVTNQLAAGAMIFRADVGGPAGEKGAFMATLEIPVNCQCGPPGFPAVDQNTGILYLPMGTTNSLLVYKFSYTSSTLTGYQIRGTTLSTAGTGGNIFPVAAVDEAGNAYVAFSQMRSGRWDIYVAVQPSGTSTWTIHKVNAATGTHVFPWIVAGEAGKIGLAWYGTTTVGDPNGMPSGTRWRVHYAQSLDALAASPTFAEWDLVGIVHDGSISLQGLFGGSDRSLGDFLSAALDPTTGKVHVAFVRNTASIPGSQRGVWVAEMPAAASPLT